MPAPFKSDCSSIKVLEMLDSISITGGEEFVYVPCAVASSDLCGLAIADVDLLIAASIIIYITIKT